MATSTDINVKCMDHTEDLLKSFNHLYEKKCFTDVTLACEDGVIEAHKVNKRSF